MPDETPELQHQELPAFATHDLDHFYRKRSFLGLKKEVNVIGVFHDRVKLEKAVGDLVENGIRSDDIYIASAHYGSTLDNPMKIASVATFATPVGIVFGAILGALLGWMSSLGILSFFGIAPFVFQSSLASISACSAVGAFVGGVLGVFIGMRFPEYNSDSYKTSFPEGTLFLVVRTDDPILTRKAHLVMDRYHEPNTPAVTDRAAA